MDGWMDGWIETILQQDTRTMRKNGWMKELCSMENRVVTRSTRGRFETEAEESKEKYNDELRKDFVGTRFRSLKIC